MPKTDERSDVERERLIQKLRDELDCTKHAPELAVELTQDEARALLAALRPVEGEPVAWLVESEPSWHTLFLDKSDARLAMYTRVDDGLASTITPLYTHPPDVTSDDDTDDTIELAWGLIANAGGGDWTRETNDWQEAAAAWRERYKARGGKNLAPVPVVTGEGDGLRAEKLAAFRGSRSRHSTAEQVARELEKGATHWQVQQKGAELLRLAIELLAPTEDR